MRRCGEEPGKEKKQVKKEKGGMQSALSGVAVIPLVQLCQENLPLLWKNSSTKKNITIVINENYPLAVSFLVIMTEMKRHN